MGDEGAQVRPKREEGDSEGGERVVPPEGHRQQRDELRGTELPFALVSLRVELVRAKEGQVAVVLEAVKLHREREGGHEEIQHQPLQPGGTRFLQDHVGGEQVTQRDRKPPQREE